MRIPHNRILVGSEEQEAVAGVLESGHLGPGPEGARFEEEMAGFMGRKGAVAVASGSMALRLCLQALGVHPGVKVMLPTLNCSALLNATLAFQGEMVVIDSATNGFGADAVAWKREAEADALAVAVHPFGAPEPLAFERQGYKAVIEDVTHSLMTWFQGLRAGTQGEAAILSCGATKLLATGSGGVILADDEGLLAEVRDLADYTGDKPYRLRESGLLSDLHAAVARARLKRLPGEVEKRRELAAEYTRLLTGAGLVLPVEAEGSRSSWYRYVVRVSGGRRDAVRERLAAQEIGTGYGVLRPLHREVHLPKNKYPNAEQTWSEMLSLPLYPALTAVQVKEVAGAVIRAVEETGSKPEPEV